ncbi:hypothetical protein BH11ARM2_BH11ARM2_29690 [soil metagenome]
MVATLPSPLPNLVVERFGWTPAHPRVGDRVTFFADIRNVGNAPTPAGKVTGLAISIGPGNPEFWSDTYTKAIAPGERVRLVPNGGAHGANTWIATGGEFPYGVYAHVNDAHRFPEISWIDNIVAKPLMVRGRGPRPSTRTSGKPDLIVESWRPLGHAFRTDRPVDFEVTVRNIGPAPTRAGEKIGVGFYTTYVDTAILWAHSDGKPLAPGARLTLRTNGGGKGYPWHPLAGRHTIAAKVNDTESIREADLENDYLTHPLTARDPAAPVQRGLILRGKVFGDQIPAEPPWTHRDRAFDGDVDTGAISLGKGEVPLGIDLGRPRRVAEVAFYPKPYSEAKMAGGRFQGSNVSATAGYVDLAWIKGTPRRGWNVLPLVGSYRYLRYLAPAGGEGMVHEICFRTPR